MGISGLDAALSGLRVAQKQLDVISNNVSNVSTPGYSRKVLPQETAVILGQTAGVRSSAVIRNVDMYLQRDVWTQVSATEFLGVKTAYLNSIQEFHGASNKELSVAADIARLRDSFSLLANQPDNALQLAETVNKAGAVAHKLNDFSRLLTTMRNDAQDAVRASVDTANSLLSQIADLNKEIKSNLALGRTTAALEDQRDTAIKNLSAEIDISFFTRGDGILVVQTKQGQQLADENATPLFFKPAPVNPASYYPESAAGLFVGGDPLTNPTAFDITNKGIGGKIGAHLEMRDSTLPQYQAQLDEVAHKLALRMEAQGIRLFTDPSGTIPADAAPVLNPPGPLTPVPYVGFAAAIQVNQAILDDPSLLRNSTLTGVTVQDGSNEFLRRVVEFGFGQYEYLEAQGTVNLNSTAPDTLQTLFGLDPKAQMVGKVDIHKLSGNLALNAAEDHPFLPVSGPPLLDNFDITINGTTVTIDLTAVEAAYPASASMSGGEALVAYLNSHVFTATTTPPVTVPPTLPGMGLTAAEASASLNQFGQLIINSQYDIEIGVGNMGDTGLSYLGLTAGVTKAVPPHFDIQVGKNDPVRVSIEPGDTEVQLLAKLNNVPGLQASLDPLTGRLNIRPGPGFGGDIRLIDGTVANNTGISVVQSLFGAASPVRGVDNIAFRTQNLGPGASLSTHISAAVSIVDYSQKMIAAQTADAVTADARQKDEVSYRELIERQFKDESGVNLDEELAQLIVIQTAYSASAKTISTLNEMFDTLLNAF